MMGGVLTHSARPRRCLSPLPPVSHRYVSLRLSYMDCKHQDDPAPDRVGISRTTGTGKAMSHRRRGPAARVVIEDEQREDKGLRARRDKLLEARK